MKVEFFFTCSDLFRIIYGQRRVGGHAHYSPIAILIYFIFPIDIDNESENYCTQTG